ncbi:MAG: glycosyltransferase, partial [Cyclobacteriaceae bacterium]|nr:glycosyltransferase [Cyclobacteriaceae bacterium]
MLSADPQLSVILSAYNAEKYVKEAIDSILNQTFTNFELIIADDGSKDKTRQIIDSYNDPRIIISHNESNWGKVNTVNRLFEMCRGEYLTIHDADDISVENRFERQINFLNKNKEYQLCGTAFSSFLEGGPLHEHRVITDSMRIKEEIKNKSCFHG